MTAIDEGVLRSAYQALELEIYEAIVAAVSKKVGYPVETVQTWISDAEAGYQLVPGTPAYIAVEAYSAAWALHEKAGHTG